MKNLLLSLIAASLFTVNAQAELKSEWTVVSDLCSRTISSSSPQQNGKPRVVCTGRIVGHYGPILIIDNAVWTFAGDEISHGRQLSLQKIGTVGEYNRFRPMLEKVIIRANAIVEGFGEKMKITFVRSHGETFQASNFQIMLHTMGLKLSRGL